MAKPKVDATAAAAGDVHYEELSRELAELLERLEDGELNVDEAVRGYERGLTIIKTLEAYLQHAENRVAELAAQADEGEEE